MEIGGDRHLAQRTLGALEWVLIGVFVGSCGCSSVGAGAGAVLRRSQEPAERTSGCIDTPFIAGDYRSTTSGINCGRERSPETSLQGRVVSEELGGLPGRGLEGLWVTLHPLEGGPIGLDTLPPARAKVMTGPQGSFSIELTGAPAYVVAVRVDPESPPLTARRVEMSGREPEGAELVLTVPVDETLRERLGGARASSSPPD